MRNAGTTGGLLSQPAYRQPWKEGTVPNRILREGIIDSRAVASLSIGAELFYRCLMSIVDDFGRYEADPDLLRVKCFPRRLAEIDGQMTVTWLAEVSQVLTDDGHPLVTVYQSTNGKKYLQINNFKQRIRAEHSKCPSPDGQMTVKCQSNDGPPHASRAQTRVVVEDDRRETIDDSRSRETESGEIYSEQPLGNHLETHPLPAGDEISRGWDRCIVEFPGEVIPKRDMPIWLSYISTDSDIEIFFSVLESWKASRKWQDGYPPTLFNYLRNEQWKIKPKPDPPRRTRTQEMMDLI
jgi:hypothetical protein